MIYRRFGRTNLQMPVFSCGGMRYQFKWNDVPPGEIPADGQANLEATIRHAVDLGINHIETARGYGSSEMQLGSILPKLPRDKIIVQTKIVPSADPKQFLDTFEKSMAYLKLDHVDLLGLHGVNTAELVEQSVRPGGCLDAARKLQKQGRVRWVGFSTHAPLDVILSAIRHVSPDTGTGFDYVNLHWYFIFQRNWPAIEEATKRDMGVFIISPSDKGGMLYKPSPEMVELCKPLHPAVFNDLFCLSHPQVHTLSIGAARPSDLDLHVQTLPLLERATQVLPPIEKRLRDAMAAKMGHPDPEQIARELPEHGVLPGDINAGAILWLRNLALGWGMVEYAKMRYNLLGNGGHWFPGQNAAKLDQIDRAAMRKACNGSRVGPRIDELLQQTHEMLGGETKKRLSQS